MMQFFTRGYALKTENKRLCTVAKALIPEKFGDACQETIGIAFLVARYVVAPKGSSESEQLLEAITKKNERDLMEIKAIYEKLMSISNTPN